MEGQAGRQRLANVDADGGWQLHTADGTPSRDAATGAKHCNFLNLYLEAPRGMSAQGSSRVENGARQAVAATIGHDRKETPRVTPPRHD